MYNRIGGMFTDQDYMPKKSRQDYSYRQDTPTANPYRTGPLGQPGGLGTRNNPLGYAPFQNGRNPYWNQRPASTIGQAWSGPLQRNPFQNNQPLGGLFQADNPALAAIKQQALNNRFATVNAPSNYLNTPKVNFQNPYQLAQMAQYLGRSGRTLPNLNPYDLAKWLYLYGPR